MKLYQQDSPMPFGKYKGEKISSLPRSYRDWLASQDGFEAQHPELHEALVGRAPAPSEAVQELIEAPEGFEAWWDEHHGSALRRVKSPNYTPFLRIALSAWKAAVACATPPSDEDIPF